MVVKRFSDIQGLKKILEREYVEGVKLSDIDVLEVAEKLAKILEASIGRGGVSKPYPPSTLTPQKK